MEFQLFAEKKHGLLFLTYYDVDLIRFLIIM